MEGRKAKNYVPPLFFEKVGDKKCTIQNNCVTPSHRIAVNSLVDGVKDTWHVHILAGVVLSV